MAEGERFILKPVTGSELQDKKSSKHIGFYIEWKPDPKLSSPASIVKGAVNLNYAAGNTARIAAATSMTEAEEVILDALLDKLARVLSVDRLNLNTSKPLCAYGVDSLVAVDVRS
ncbi:hypothetical protein ANO14919_112230 [Xylariales sp. No.14919]|nr:hypothetical protein ANO14919_112230 [Xylariales sp. No.14919]